MKAGVVVFPGSNCDHDAWHVIKDVLGQQAEFLWHKDRDLKGCDLIIIPGGFSYGDYLRCGAIARFSPVMDEVVSFAKKGGRVLGICNGFQILTEAGLLPGVLLRNASRKFICRWVDLKVENVSSPFTRKLEKGRTLRIPIAHAEGNYYVDDDGLKRLEDEGRVAFRYVENPNGARHDIAGILNERGNVLGMMPHPERASEKILGSDDGRAIFESLLES
ncbi:MAG: phosphoribosylformylglycinamidine synthase subunit PurQ [Myxococcaceae bacterium]|nr:phosphoribosylformylglycinamidine synthase subunit PurQ [Myxococcaceae bacterium]